MAALIRIGTRGSPLALAQAHETQRRLAEAWPDLAAPDAIEIVVIKTTGDKILDRPLSEAGGKGLFTKEIEEALADSRVDIAVHSMKDVPTFPPEVLELDCYLPREDPRDGLIAPGAASIDALPQGARIGTASLRRQALLKALRPDFVVETLRGNVQTRLSAIAEGRFDATLLAMAGLNRLGLADDAKPIATEQLLPAVAQGAVGLQRRADDVATAERVAKLNCVETASRAIAERAVLKQLDGSCRTPIAALAEVEGERMRLRAVVASPDGAIVHRDEDSAPKGDGEALGDALGARLRAAAGPGFLPGWD